MNEPIVVATEGLGHGDTMAFEPGPIKCGGIKDGVGINLNWKILKGGWVVSFSDLEKVYLECKRIRDHQPITKDQT